jgi:hypothetical protein
MNSSLNFISFSLNLQRTINYYFSVSFPVMGIVLNTISLFVFLRPSLNKTNMGFLYLSQTTVDLILLIYYVFVVRAPLIFGYTLTNRSEPWCKFWQLFRRFILQASSWMCVFITFDRFVYVLRPNGLGFLKRKKSITLAIAFMFSLLIGINAPNLLFYLDVSLANSSSNATHVSMTVLGTCRGMPAIQVLTDLVSTVMRTWLPILTMIVLDILIIKKLNENKMKLRARKSSMQKKENHYTKNVILLNFLFFAFNSPIAIGFFIESMRSYTNLATMSALGGSIFDLYFQIAGNISFAYQSLSFFINIISNRLYRNEIYSLFKFRLNKVHEESINSTAVSMKRIETINNKEAN